MTACYKVLHATRLIHTHSCKPVFPCLFLLGDFYLTFTHIDTLMDASESIHQGLLSSLCAKGYLARRLEQPGIEPQLQPPHITHT